MLDPSLNFLINFSSADWSASFPLTLRGLFFLIFSLPTHKWQGMQWLYFAPGNLLGRPNVIGGFKILHTCSSWTRESLCSGWWGKLMAVSLHHKNKAQNLNETHLLLYPIDIGFQASISKEKLKSSILFTLKFCFWSMQLVDFNFMYFKIVNAIACSNQWSNFIQLLGIWLNTRVRYLPSCNEDIL